MGGRYIKDATTETIHDRQSADERCNVDDIASTNRRTSDDLKLLITPKSHFCRWCMTRRAAREGSAARAAQRHTEPPLSEPSTEPYSAPEPPQEEDPYEPTPSTTSTDPGDQQEGPTAEPPPAYGPE